MGLFVDPEGQRWVLWTPEGFLDSATGGDALIGYHLNHGPDQEGEFVRVEQLMTLFYRPTSSTETQTEWRGSSARGTCANR